ncbi:MAG: YggS family pyridoxal phosphate-dependent enzyme [Ruminococcaceae bacterium]|nr:YggS family pyridoxal phosphate-dependent enzyme [Oscillospiraceae bacterium]
MNIEEKKKQIKENIDRIKNEIGDRDVVLLAATKMNSPELINYAIECGITHIGENKVQELLDKYDDINKDNVKIHFIGALQTNKVKYIVDKVSMIQSVDRLSLAQEIDKRCKAIGKVMDILVEVNIGNEEAKSGVSPENLEATLKVFSQFENISVKGLMFVPPIFKNFDEQSYYLKKIRDLYIDISRKKLDNIYIHVLSFGMSNDYIAAMDYGSNMIRIGSGIFGARNYAEN